MAPKAASGEGVQPKIRERVRIGLVGLEEDLRMQQDFLVGRVPPYVELLGSLRHLLAVGRTGPAGEVRARLEATWEERRFFAVYDRPLMLLASLRADALREGAAHPLFGPLVEASEGDAIPEADVLSAFASERAALWQDLARRRVQTNETMRAVAWLWPGHLAGCSGGARPLAIVDVGASAGLNLVADALPDIWSAGGEPLPIVQGADVVRRIGIDARPVDLRSDEEVRWLCACIWPTDVLRLERFDAAVPVLRSALANGAAQIVPLDVSELPDRLARWSAELPPAAFVLAYQTVMRAYLSPETWEKYRRGMQDWLATEPPGRAVWVELEAASEPTEGPPAALYAHFRATDPGVRTVTLARCEYHPRELVVDQDAVARLEAVCR